MHLWKHKSYSRGYDNYAQGSLLFRLLMALQLFSSCRSLMSFSQDPSLQKTLSFWSWFSIPHRFFLLSVSSRTTWPDLLTSSKQQPTLTKYYTYLPFICHHFSSAFCYLFSTEAFTRAVKTLSLWLPPQLGLSPRSDFSLGFCHYRCPQVFSSGSHCLITHLPSPRLLSLLHRPFSRNSHPQLPLLILTTRGQALAPVSEESPAPICQHLTCHREIQAQARISPVHYFQ